MKTTALFSLSLAAFIANLNLPTALAFHDHEKDEKMMMCGKMTKEDLQKKMAKHEEKFLKKYDLTKDQQKKIQAVNAGRVDHTFALIQEERAAHTALMDAMERDADSAELREKTNTLFAKKQAVMMDKEEGMLQIHDILTKDQRMKSTKDMKKKYEEMCD